MTNSENKSLKTSYSKIKKYFLTNKLKKIKILYVWKIYLGHNYVINLNVLIIIDHHN